MRPVTARNYESDVGNADTPLVGERECGLKLTEEPLQALAADTMCVTREPVGGGYRVDGVFYFADELIGLIKRWKPDSVLFSGISDTSELYCISVIGALTRTAVSYVDTQGETITVIWASNSRSLADATKNYARRFISKDKRK